MCITNFLSLMYLRNFYKSIYLCSSWSDDVQTQSVKPSVGGGIKKLGLWWLSGLHLSRHPSAVHTVWTWSACRPTPVHVGPSIVPAWAVAHQKVSATGALHGPLLHQGSRPMWVKTSRRPKKPPRSSIRTPPWLSTIRAYRHSCPASSQEETSGLP